MAKAILHEWKAEQLRIVVVNTYDLFKKLDDFAEECAKREISNNLLLRWVYLLVHAAAEMESCCYRTNYLDRKAAAEMLVEEVREMADWKAKHVLWKAKHD